MLLSDPQCISRWGHFLYGILSKFTLKTSDNGGWSSLPFNTNLYRVFSELGLVTLTMTKTCWNWERTVRGEKGWAPGSWNTMVTMSLPMWRFRSSCKPTVKYKLCYNSVLCCNYTTNWIPATAKLGKLQPFSVLGIVNYGHSKLYGHCKLQAWQAIWAL